MTTSSVPGADLAPVPSPVVLDDESAAWVRSLSDSSPDREAALGRLHALLLRVARAEAGRRSSRTQVHGPELDDIAHQAAADALLSITGKLAGFRGESRFTTWAYAFVVFEVAGKVNRHHWRRPGTALQPADWDRLPDRFGLQPEDAAESQELLAALRRVVDGVLTDRQREVFVALVVTGMPLDELAATTGSTRGAIYKVMFDARRKIRAALVADGHLEDAPPARRSAS